MIKLSSKYFFIIKVIAIVVLSISGAWLLLKGLYFSAALIGIVIIVLAFSVYHDRKKLITRMERLIAGIRHSDFSTYFAHASSQDELHRLSQEMNEALEIFRNRTHDSMMDEAETQAWQKLIRVLMHEIMNSIAPIISLSETLSEREISNETTAEEYEIMKQAMQTIHRRSKGLLAFVDNYRKLTRIPQPMLQPIHLHAMLHALQQLEASHHILFSYSVYPEKLVLHADRNMVEQTLINLVKNAHEACGKSSKPKIEVKAEKIGSEIQLSVSDNGYGISSEAIDKIFIPFYSTKSNGSGIGLSLCRQIMTRHKGKISVTSNSDGSQFTLHFPA